MILRACSALKVGPETRVWYRALEPGYLPTALRTAQTKIYPSRYGAGANALRPFEVLYLAEDHQVALYEVRALLGAPFAKAGVVVVPNPLKPWTILNVRVTLQKIADLTRASEQDLLDTTAQELTGDWEGYQERKPHDSVNKPVGIAPTQALGQALYDLPDLEGFRTISARLPARMILVVFPAKLLPGSEIVFSDGAGHTHRIKPRLKRRRRSP